MISLLLAAAFAPSPTFEPPTRPRDIWVFRSVLDKHARMVTIALSDELWVAYDATNCGLYKAWKGGVKFDGAVYTTVHGPQPTSEGRPYAEYDTSQPFWYLSTGGNVSEVRPRFRGYRFRAGQVTLKYELSIGDRTVAIHETPEDGSTSDSQTVFERTYRVTGLAPGEILAVRLAQPLDRIDTNGILTNGSVLTLLPNATTRIAVSFDHIPTVPIRLRAPMEPQEQVQYVPGAALRIYQIGVDLTHIPVVLPGQTPNVNTVIPTIDLDGDAAFGGLSKRFYAQITADLLVPTTGTYELRLTSDDGSRLALDGKTLIDNDGLHSAGAVTASADLTQGAHVLLVEFFEQDFDQILRLEWKKPGDADFSVVPSANLRTPEGEVKVTSPGIKNIFDPRRRMKPGDGLWLDGVHPSLDLATIRPEDFKPRVGGIDFLPDGRMVICNWEPEGGVYLLSGILEDAPDKIQVKRIAAGLAEPLGIKVVNGVIYVLQKQELTKLIDHNGDDVIDEYYALANGWGVTDNFHEFAFGLEFEGSHFYANLATAIDPGGASTQPQNPDRGKVVKINAVTGDFTFVAHGLRTPNGIGRGVGNRIYITDNQGDWLPSSKVLPLKEGAFYGGRSVDFAGTSNLPVTPPIVWLPQGEIGNSPSQPAPLNYGPYRGQMIHGDVTHGGLKRVFVEEVEGVQQGVVFRYTQGLEAGINRVAIGPDGAIYVGGIGSTGNWGQEGKERFGLQRLRYNGKPVFEPLAMRAFANGFEIEFTEPMAPLTGNDPGDYRVSQWRYVPTAQYGGPKVDLTKLTVGSVTWSSDRTRAFLEIDGLKEGQVVHVWINRGVLSAALRDLWTTEAWYTLNKLPNRRHDTRRPTPINTLTQEERDQGFEMLFDGRSLDKWRGYNMQTVPKDWRSENSLLTCVPGTEGGDLMTNEQYGDFELRLEWRISEAGNSGVMFRSQERYDAPWKTGPEMQILDDDLAGGADLEAQYLSGSDYDMHARARDMLRPTGEWNEFRIVARGKHVEYWFNGTKVVEYEVDSPDWLRRYEASKFNDYPEHARLPQGHIVLQNHGHPVWFRNIRIKRL